MSCAFVDYYNYSLKILYYMLLAAQYEKKNENSKLEKKFRKFSQPNSLHLQAAIHDFPLTQCRTIYETNERKN